MLKILVICIAILIAVANGSAQTSGNKRYVSHKPGVVRVGPTTTYLKEGLSTEQVIRLSGHPSPLTTQLSKAVADKASVQATHNFVLLTWRRAEGGFTPGCATHPSNLPGQLPNIVVPPRQRLKFVRITPTFLALIDHE